MNELRNQLLLEWLTADKKYETINLFILKGICQLYCESNNTYLI